MTPFGSGLVITRPQICAEHRAICTKMGHSFRLSMAFVHQHPQDALAVLRHRFPQIDPAVLENSFAVVEKSMPPTPAIVEAAVSNSDRLNIEAGFMTPDEKLASYSDLSTND